MLLGCRLIILITAGNELVKYLAISIYILFLPQLGSLLGGEGIVMVNEIIEPVFFHRVLVSVK
jgi:hypothetical protein